MAKRKGTINRIFNGRDYYYAYRLPPDIFGNRKRLYAKTEKELLAKIEKAKQEKEQNLRTYKPNTKNLSGYIAYYFRHAVGCFTTADIERMKLLFEKNILNSKLDKDIDTLTTKEINSYYHELSEWYPPASIKEINLLVQNAFTLAIEDGIASNVDFSQIIIPDSSINRGKKGYILSPEEFDVILNYCIDDKCDRYGNNEYMIIVIMLTGLPISSLVNLQYKDVDLERGVLILEDREYALPDEAKQWFTEHLKENKQPSDAYLFATKNNTPPSRQNVLFTIGAIAKQCGMPSGVSGKTLQKAYIVSELSKGTSKDVLCQRLGLRSTRTITATQREYKLSRYNPIKDD